jgi:hypothetical protein
LHALRACTGAWAHDAACVGTTRGKHV